MIRPLTFLCMLSTVGSGLYLYTEKHSAEMLDRQIGKAIHGTQAARERTGLLRAEWAVLNDPARLQTMADQYLGLILAPACPPRWRHPPSRPPTPTMTRPRTPQSHPRRPPRRRISCRPPRRRIPGWSTRRLPLR
jgi:hypothetical protein